ncbi:protein of unknown function [Pararobbsia alpina]
MNMEPLKTALFSETLGVILFFIFFAFM